MARECARKQSRSTPAASMACRSRSCSRGVRACRRSPIPIHGLCHLRRPLFEPLAIGAQVAVADFAAAVGCVGGAALWCGQDTHQDRVDEPENRRAVLDQKQKPPVVAGDQLGARLFHQHVVPRGEEVLRRYGKTGSRAVDLGSTGRRRADQPVVGPTGAGQGGRVRYVGRRDGARLQTSASGEWHQPGQQQSMPPAPPAPAAQAGQLQQLPAAWRQAVL